MPKYSLKAKLIKNGAKNVEADSIEMLTNNLILPKLSIKQPHIEVETVISSKNETKNEEIAESSL